MKASGVFIMMLLLGMTAQAQDISQYEAGEFKQAEKELPYRILWPADFDSSRQYPLLVFLHGSGERGHDNQAQLTHGARLFLEQQSRFPALVVFPQCPAGDSWIKVPSRSDSEEKQGFHFRQTEEPTPALGLVIGLLDSLLQQNYVDQSRVYLGGLSLGGMGTFDLLSRRPDMFAAAFPICGGGDPTTVADYAGQVPVWIFHGAQDKVVDPEYSRLMAQAIRHAGGEVILTVYPNANHNSWDKAFAEPQLLPWLFSQARPE